MNKERRKRIFEIREKLEEISSALEELQSEEEEARDNLPEGLQEIEMGEMMDQAAYCLMAASEAVGEAVEQLEDESIQG